jgi:sec-independent protein translocase protein TatA
MSSVFSWLRLQEGIAMDSIFGIGMNELVIIFLLAAIVLGPERLVRVAREAGKLIRNVKAYFSSFTDELKTELDVLDEIKDLKNDLKK